MVGTANRATFIKTIKTFYCICLDTLPAVTSDIVFLEICTSLLDLNIHFQLSYLTSFLLYTVRHIGLSVLKDKSRYCQFNIFPCL